MGKFAILAILATLLFAAPASTVRADEDGELTLEEIQEEIAAREAQIAHLNQKYDTKMEFLAIRRDWFEERGMQRQADKFQWHMDKLTERYERFLARLQARLDYLQSLLPAEPPPEEPPTP